MWQFCTGIHDPQSEKTFNLAKIKEINDVNYIEQLILLILSMSTLKIKKMGIFQ